MSPILILLALPLFFVALYATTLGTIYGLTGWPHAAKVMPAPEGLKGRRCWVARLLLVRMNGLLKLGFTDDGVYLQLPRLWRLNAGNILIPYHRLEGVEVDAGLFGPIARMDIEGWGSLHCPTWVLEEWEARGKPGFRPESVED